MARKMPRRAGPQPSRRVPRARRRSETPAWLGPAVLAAAVLAVYAGVTDVPLLFDDQRTLSHLEGMGPAAIVRDAPTRALSSLSFAVNGALGGGLAGYHAVNVGVHLANALLLFGLLGAIRRLRAPWLPAWAPLAGALLWALHPLQTSAVTYISQRIASLAALAYLGACFCYLRAREARCGGAAWVSRAHLGWYGGALAVALLAVGTKENTATLPVALLLIEWLVVASRAPESIVGRLLWLAPFLLTPAIEMAVLFSFREKVGAMVQPVPGQGPGGGGVTAVASGADRGESALKGLSFAYMGAYQGWDFPTAREYLLTQPGVVLGYLKLWVLPVNQVFDDLVVPVTKIRDARLLLPALALLALLGAGLKQIRRQPLVAFGVLWFFLTMIVESSVIPLADFRFEHRMLLPSAGLTVAAVAWIGPAIARRPRAGGALLAAAALALAGATLARNRVWADPVTFWSDNVAKAPGKLRGWLNLSHAYERADQLELAEDALLRAVAVFERSPELHYNLGVVRMRQGKPGAAEASLRRALALFPLYAEAHYNLGTLLAETGRRKAAENAFLYVIQIQEAYVAEAHYNLGVLYLREGRPEAAARALEAAVAAQPGLMPAHHNLAVAYERLGKAEDARRHAAIAARLQAGGKKGAER